MIGCIDRLSQAHIFEKKLASLSEDRENSVLDFSHLTLGIPELQKVEKTLNNRRVSEINLSFADIGDAEAEYLSSFLKTSTQVHKLNLIHNRIGTEGACSLASLVENCPGLQLDVRFNQIGPEGGEALARAYIKSGYSEIDLSCNALGDSGADKIASVLSKNHGTILSLALPDNGITLKGDAFLAQKVPKRIRIFHRVEKVNFLNFVTSSPAKIFFAILFFPLLLFFLCKTYRVEKEGCIHQRTASS